MLEIRDIYQLAAVSQQSPTFFDEALSPEWPESCNHLAKLHIHSNSVYAMIRTHNSCHHYQLMIPIWSPKNLSLTIKSTTRFTIIAFLN